MSEVEISFGNVLRKIRKERNMSQEKLAFVSGLDRSYISLLERGKRSPQIINVFKLSAALDVEPHKIIKQVEDLMS